METKNYGSLIEGLIVNMPDVMMVSLSNCYVIGLYAIEKSQACLDKGITKSASDSEDSKSFYVSI